MLENIGLGGVLTFNGSQAVVGMNEAAGASDRLTNSQRNLKSVSESITSGLAKAGGAMIGIGALMAPLSAGVWEGIHSTMGFEKQMSAVNAILLASESDFDRLIGKAKDMASVTVYSSQEAGQAMESMARSGANVEEVMNGLSGVMATAASDDIALGTAADIVAQVIRGLGMDYAEANRVADVLATTSARTNTNVTSLGESFKYAASQSRIMGIDLETTSTLLGAIADAGLRGAIGGTSYAAMLVKLAAPSKKGAAWLAQHNIQMTKTATGALDVIDVLRQLTQEMGKETDVVHKAAMAHEVFGVRGQKAFSAIEASMKSGRFDTVFEQITNSEGNAAKMADRRLNNLAGRLKLLKSSLQVISEDIFLPIYQPALDGLKKLADGIGEVSKTIRALERATNPGDYDKILAEHGQTMVAIAQGIRDATTLLRDGFTSARQTVGEFFGYLEEVGGPNFVRQVTKWGTIVMIIGGLLAPVFLAVGTAIMVLGPVIEGIASAVSGVGEAAAIAAAVVAVAYGLLSTEGESLGDFMGRMWYGIKDAVMYVYDNAIVPFASAFIDEVKPAALEVWETIKQFAEFFRGQFKQLFGSIVVGAGTMAPLFRGVFSLIGQIIGFTLKTAIYLFGALLQAIAPVIVVLKNIGITLVEMVVNGLKLLAQAIVAVDDALGTEYIPKESPLRKFANEPMQWKTDLEYWSATNNIGAGYDKDKEASQKAKEATDAMVDKEGTGTGTRVKVDVNLEDKRQLEITNCMNVDGRQLAMAQATHKQEINERAGFRTTPWQRRAILEHGAAPVAGVALGGG